MLGGGLVILWTRPPWGPGQIAARRLERMGPFGARQALSHSLVFVGSTNAGVIVSGQPPRLKALVLDDQPLL